MVSVVLLEACPGCGGVRARFAVATVCTFRGCLEEKQVRADRAFLALPKYVGFFESFLRHEPAAATDMVAVKSPPSTRLSSPCPADPNGHEANPAISCGVMMVAFTSMFF
jgi:hypothetical protein